MSSFSSILQYMYDNPPPFDRVMIGTIVIAAMTLPLVGKFVDRLYQSIRLEVLLYRAKHNNDNSNVIGVVSTIYVHPVKSMRAISMEESFLDTKGLVNDRRFMVVYELPLPPWKVPGTKDAGWATTETSHRFLTQRQCPSLATIVATITSNNNNKQQQILTLSYTKNKKTSKKEEVTIQLSNNNNTSPDAASQVYRAGIWDDTVLVEDMGDEVAEFLRQIVNEDEECTIQNTTSPTRSSTSSSSTSISSIRLVRHHVPDRRAVDTTYLPNVTLNKVWGTSPLVSLTDGFPILIANERSLDDLNHRLEVNNKDPIPMTRFRPNIVVGPPPSSPSPPPSSSSSSQRQLLQPFEEDRWKIIAVGEQLFAIVKACPRCKQSCTDQITGVVDTEPLSTMKSFRQLSDIDGNGDVFFAQNAVPIVRLFFGGGQQPKPIKVGDPIRVLEYGEPIYR